MNCSEARELLSHGFPSALGPREREAQQHLRRCDRCRSYLDADLELCRRLRELEPEKASSRFKQRLFTQISKLRWEKSRRERQGRFRRLASIAVAIILLVAGWLWLNRAPEPASRLVDYLIEDHQQNLPGHLMTMTSSPPEIESWFEGKVDFPFRVPVLEEAEIVEARLCRVEGRRAALVRYSCRSHMLSWFTFPQSRKHGPKESPAVLTVQGYHLIMWDENGLTHAVVSDMDPGELIRMLSGQRG